MEREILFRGCGINTGEWYYGDLIKRKICGQEKYLFSIAESGPVEIMQNGRYRYAGESISHIVKEETVGQYTGINDIDGERIFEGDYVKWSDADVLGGQGEVYGTVEFSEGQWWVQPAGKWPVPLFCETAEIKVLEYPD